MHEQVKRLLELPKYEQKSEEWFKQRNGKFTASSISSVLKMDHNATFDYIEQYKLDPNEIIRPDKCANQYTSKEQFFYNKCTSAPFTGNIATFWGQKYEQVVADIYSVNHNVKLYEFGLIEHPEYNWMGASPDGITEDGIMLEIKCPSRRKITGIAPFYYYIQCQIQMETCNLDYCDFVEYNFVEYATRVEFVDDSTLDFTPIEKGILIQINKFKDSLDNEYIYPPKELIKDLVGMIEWSDNVINNYITNNDLAVVKYDKDSGFIHCVRLCGRCIGITNITSIRSPECDKYCRENLFIKTVYWKVKDKSEFRIKRSKEWFKLNLPVINTAYLEFIDYKKNDKYKDYVEEPVKKRVKYIKR